MNKTSQFSKALIENYGNKLSRIVRLISYLAFWASLIVISSAAASAEDLCQAASKAIKDAEQIRGLSLKKTVPCLVKDRTNIRNYILEVIDRDLAPLRIEHEEIIYKALQLIPQDYAYKQGMIELYTSQIGGYYDPKQKHFVMASWIPLSLQYPVAVHELTHALQDQYYNLKDFTNMQELSSDTLLARSALVEGDATAVMLDYSAHANGQPSLSDKVTSDLFNDPSLLTADAHEPGEQQNNPLVHIILFPYSAGLKFAQVLLKQGGYVALDRAYARPPRSTKEILHPEEYLHSKLKIIEFSDKDVELSNNQTILFTDVLGEFFISVWLANLGIQQEIARKIATGWSGDFIALIRTDKGGHSIKWRIAWQTGKQAELFAKSLRGLKQNSWSVECAKLICTIDIQPKSGS